MRTVPNAPDAVCCRRAAQHDELGSPLVGLVFHINAYHVEAGAPREHCLVKQKQTRWRIVGHEARFNVLDDGANLSRAVGGRQRIIVEAEGKALSDVHESITHEHVPETSTRNTTLNRDFVVVR